MTIHARNPFELNSSMGTGTTVEQTGILMRPAQPTSYYPAGAEIYGQGDRARNLYQVTFGAVRVYRLLADGRRQISAFHLSGEVFGFEPDATHHFFAEAIGATGIRVLYPTPGTNYSQEILPMVLKDLSRAQEHLLVVGRQNAVERVAAFLLDMYERQGGLSQFELPMSRTDIADYLGLTIETVSRVFSKLKEQAIIRLPTCRNVEIVRLRTLRDMSE
jgi:CRP/FNR family nitrogen fixation transcriptional regulator